jgi:hypothetical protein
MFDFVSKALTDPDHTSQVSAIQMMGIMCSGELGLVCTTSIIVLQMAATRFTPHVAKLFFGDPFVISGLGFYAVLNIYVVWLSFAVAGGYNARYGMLILVILFTISLALCLPFFVFLFFFVNPKKVIEKIMDEAIRECTNPKVPNVLYSQGVSIEGVERLSYFALHALNHQDISLALYATDAMCSSTIVYGENKALMPVDWHKVSESTRSSSDFFTLSERAIDGLQERKTWFEFKVLKQYQCLFEKSLASFRALGFRVCVDTREIAESAGLHGDLDTFDLCCKFMNTFIRKAVNSKDINMVCGCLHQYRQMAEFLLIQRGMLMGEKGLSDSQITERPLHILKCMRYYAHLCIDRDLGFVAKVATFDMSIIVKRALNKTVEGSERFLDVLVSMSARNNITKLTLQGIRQTQVTFATDLLLAGDTKNAKCIYKCMEDDATEVLQGVYNDLKYVEEQDFWEVSERNTNIDFITEEQKKELETFFRWFPSSKGLVVGDEVHANAHKQNVASFGLTRTPSSYVMSPPVNNSKKSVDPSPASPQASSPKSGATRGKAGESKIFNEADEDKASDDDEDDERAAPIEGTEEGEETHRRSLDKRNSSAYSMATKINM